MEDGWNDLFQGISAPWVLSRSASENELFVWSFIMGLVRNTSHEGRELLSPFCFALVRVCFCVRSLKLLVFLQCFITYNNIVSVYRISFPSEEHSRGWVYEHTLDSLQLLWCMYSEALIHCGFVGSLKLLGENNVSVLCPISYLCCLRQNVSTETVFIESMLNCKSSAVL